MQIETGEMYPTFWAKTEKIKGNLFGKYTYVKGDIPSTRFAILFNLYTLYQINFSKSLYDSEEECLAECKELDELYKNHSLPIIKEYKDKNPVYDFSDHKSWWGYIVLDFKLKQIIKVGGHGFKTVRGFKFNPHKSYTGIYKIKGANIPEVRDYFFRDVDEVPDNYKWDANEYEGWLQFKWGDGKNAIGYVEEEKKKERPGADEILEVYNEATDSYVKRKFRVVYVDWNDPLPKPQKGITYLRPNKEPVMFPGEFGFENDYSLQEWALSEEIAADEYLDNGGTFKPESTSNSLANMLGDDNPLLKLKFNYYE